MMSRNINTVPTSFIRYEEVKEEEIFDEDPLCIEMKTENIEKSIKKEIVDIFSCA